MLRVSSAVLILLCAAAIPSSAQTSHLIVTVTDETGAPVPDARVQVLRSIEAGGRTLVAAGLTDARGTFEVSVEAIHAYVIRVTHAQYVLPASDAEGRSSWLAEGDVAMPFTLLTGKDPYLVALLT